MIETRVAFLDASVLYPALLRDILMRLALHGLFQARWSPQVQDEWCAALRRNRPDLEPDQIERTRSLMEKHMPDASVTGFERRIESLVLPDAGDRHVLAAAIHCGAQTIVTSNLRDFPDDALARYDLSAVHPDDFLQELVRRDKAQAVTAMRRLRAALKNPPMSGADLLSTMKRNGLIATAKAIGRL